MTGQKEQNDANTVRNTSRKGGRCGAGVCAGGAGAVCLAGEQGSANGSWTRVGKAEISSTANTITTDKFEASLETWNAGWFAVVAQRPSGMTVIVR